MKDNKTIAELTSELVAPVEKLLHELVSRITAVLAEPEAAEPDAAEPDAAEPDAAEPDAAEPDAAEPDAAEPDAAEPDAAEPDAAEPDAAEPDAAMSGGEVMFHYTLSTCHTEKTPRSDVRLERLAALRSTVEVAIGGKAVPLPGFPYYALSIRNTWTGAVGWLIEGAERRVLVRCVTAWTGGGVTKGLAWLAATLPADLALEFPCCLVKPGVAFLKDSGAASCLDDAERCISWALVDASAPPTPRRRPDSRPGMWVVHHHY